MAEPKNDAFLDDPEMMEEEEFDLDAAMEEDPDASPKSGRAAMDALIAERDEMHDRLMRALAEAENVRKRAARERIEGEQFGGSKLARDMLPVYDNLRRALDAAGEASDGVIEGVKLTLKEILSVFNKHGITLIAPEVGDRFNPQVHEAMFEAPLAGTRSGEIIQVASEGFLLHDRLLRPAQVGVSSTPAS